MLAHERHSKGSCLKCADQRIRPGVVQLGWIGSNMRQPHTGLEDQHGAVGQEPVTHYSTATKCASQGRRPWSFKHFP